MVIWGAVAVVSNIVNELGKALKDLNMSQLSLYGVYSILFTVTDSIKLHNMWAGKGQYAHKKLSLFKKLKTTIYISSSRMFELGFYGVTLLMSLGLITISAPLSIAFMAAYSLNGVVRYGHSLIRAFIRDRALNPNAPDCDEQQKAANYKMINASVKLALALLIAVIMTASIVLTGPFAPYVRAALWVTWGVSTVVYNAVIRPKMKAKLNPNSIQPSNYIELQSVKSSKFLQPDMKRKCYDSLTSDEPWRLRSIGSSPRSIQRLCD